MEVNKYRQPLSVHKSQRLKSGDVYLQVNPEESATSSLIELSDDALINNVFEQQQFPQSTKNREKNLFSHRKLERKNSNLYKGRLSVADNFTECHKMARKVSPYNFQNNQTQSIFKRSAINPSRFLLFQNGKLINWQLLQVGPPKLFEPVQNGAHHYKGLKNINSFIRRRKTIFSKQKPQNKRVEVSTAHSSQLKKGDESRVSKQKMIKSCELQDQIRQFSPMKILSPSKIEQIPNMQLRCTSPNFKYKRFLNYRKILANSQEKGMRNS